MNTILGVFLVAVTMAAAQRPFYAGLKPIGYPELADRFQSAEDATSTTTAASLGNRFGEDGQTVSTTTVRLPVDALGDKNLIDRISKWPVDKQPYWYINWKLIEAHRQQRPTIQEPSPVNNQPQQPSANVPQQNFGQPSANVPQQNFNQPQQPFNNNQPSNINQQGVPQRQQWRDNRRNEWQPNPQLGQRSQFSNVYWQ